MYELTPELADLNPPSAWIRYVKEDDYAALEDVSKALHEDLVRTEAECERLAKENKMLKENLEETEERSRDMSWARATGGS